MTILVFILLLSFLVIIHELGHFFAAKWAKVKTEEFGLGYPPKAIRLFRWMSTDFTLNWIPFGGFVRMYGEDQAHAEADPKAKEHGAFFTKTKWQRAVIIAAGPLVNFIFGVIAFSALFSVYGIPESQGIMITGVSPDSPAQTAGLMENDVVKSVVIDNQPKTFESVTAFVTSVREQQGKEVILELDRAGELITTEVYIRTASEIPEGQGALGVSVSPVESGFTRYPWWQMPFRGAYTGIQVSLEFSLEILRQLSRLLPQLLTGRVPADVAGPIGIVHQASEQDLLSSGLGTMVNFVAILSINLAIMNILPIPALDGGRLLMILIETITRRRVSPTYERWIHTVGFIGLLALITLVSFRDVSRILSGL